MSRRLQWDRSLPFEWRRNIGEFEDHTEHILGELVYIYSASTRSVSVYVPSSLRRYDEKGFELCSTAIAFAPPFDHDDTINTVVHTSAPLGYESPVQGKDCIRWMNEADDGYIILLFLDDGRAGLYVASGCRPTDGITKVGRARNIPDWEHELTPNVPQSQNHHTPKHAARENQASTPQSREHSSPTPTIRNTPNPKARGLGELGLSSVILEAQRPDPHSEAQGPEASVSSNQYQA